MAAWDWPEIYTLGPAALGLQVYISGKSFMAMV